MFLSFFARNDDISVGWDFYKRGVEEKPLRIRKKLLISFPFLLVLLLKKKEEQESSLDFVIVMIREGLFSLCAEG